MVPNYPRNLNVLLTKDVCESLMSLHGYITYATSSTFVLRDYVTTEWPSSTEGYTSSTLSPLEKKKKQQEESVAALKKCKGHKKGRW